MTHITLISDLHGYKPSLPGGDLLIIAGDLTARDRAHEYAEFDAWLHEQNYRKKIVIGGNHDAFIEESDAPFTGYKDPEYLKELTYLCDSGTEFDGLKIWGSPWTLQFEGMNPRCRAFTRGARDSLKDRWDLIPEDTDILITHCPPYGYFDKTLYGDHVGDLELREAVDKRIHPKVHVFGHIHEGGGRMLKTKLTTFVNASHVDVLYKPSNGFIELQL